MSKLKLDILATIQLAEITGGPSIRVAKTQKNPKDNDLRLFSDGSCYPSQKLLDEFKLEYQDKGSEKEEFGFDIFQTEKWGMWPASEHFVMIASVTKHASKVDLFGKTSYDKEGKPRSSVMDQGAATFGKRLIGMLEQTYDQELFTKGNNFVDLNILRESAIPPTPNNIYNIPKLMVKGEKAGTYNVERRENIIIYPLVIVEDTLQISNVEQDPSVGELSSLDTSDAGQYAHEPPLEVGEKISMAEAQEIIGVGGSDSSDNDLGVRN